MDVNEGFVIDSDEKAEWALEKIKAAREERDRLWDLVIAKQEELDRKKTEIEERYEQETSYLLFRLKDYMETVKVKSTKTQDTYQLLSGKLVRKKPSVDYIVNQEELLGWLQSNNMGEYIKTVVSPKWGEIKKLLTGNTETGFATTEAGEVVDGVTAIEKQGSFEIKF